MAVIGERTALQRSNCSVGQIGAILHAVTGCIVQTQCFFDFVWSWTGRNFGAFDEHKFDGDCALHIAICFIGTRLQGQNLRRCWSNDELIDADQAKAKEFRRIVGFRATIVDLEQNLRWLVCEVAAKMKRFELECLLQRCATAITKLND